MATPQLSDWLQVSPAVAAGEDAPIDLTGPTDPTGWALAAYASLSPNGPPLALSGLSVAVVGGDTNVIRVTLSAALTAALTLSQQTLTTTLYVEVWRTDAGNARPLRRLRVPVYDPVK